jgi:RNA polymerase sigma-70 factor (ECF subfamily)
MTTGDLETATGDVAELYVATGRRLVGLLVSVGPSPTLAEDLLQDAYAKLVPRWETVRRYDNPEAWVRTVALRLYLSHERRNRLFRRHAPTLQADNATEGPGPDRVALEQALAALPAQHRIAIVLHYLLDQSVVDIAGTLKVSSGTVKSRLSRARGHLAEALGERADVLEVTHSADRLEAGGEVPQRRRFLDHAVADELA